MNCITYYLTLDYVCNQIQPIVCKVKEKPPNTFQKDIFQENTNMFQ
jgi:hypothetical protein